MALTWARRQVSRLALGAALGCASIPVFAQDERSVLRTLTRDVAVRGLPALEIDLEERSLQRYALIIGNGDYDSAEDLPNAVADARLISSLLKNAGFTVADFYNLDKPGFESALRQALYEIEFGAELFIFYAGHGVQIGSGNYLIPTDMDTGSVYDVPMSTVSLSGIMSVVGARARSVTVVLDSCRNNPFPDQKGIMTLDGTPRSLQTGFTASETPINSLLIYSTSPGSLALDGDGENSPFTDVFVNELTSNPSTPIDELMKDVRRKVYHKTGKLQVPWSSSSLVEPIALGALAQSKPMETPGSAAEGAVNVAGQLNRKVRLGETLMGQASEDQLVAVIEPPRVGRVELNRNGTLQTLQARQPLRLEEVGNLVYSTNTFGITREQNAGTLRHSDQFQMQFGDRLVQVEVDLDVNECDRAAGDHLDPESVGIALYPNEIEPVKARDACLAAIRENPDVGRFHYQLGRAQLALLQFDDARRAFQRAADLDHTRAYHGLGTLEIATASSGGRAPETAMAYLLEGVMRGDPYAYHSLGLQLMKYPVAESDEREGFGLISRAIELGHTFSMNALGLYFLDENAAHYDPERGLRYLRESASRGDIYGWANLGYVALTGVGGQEKDFDAAADWFRKAASEGHPGAATALGRMYLRGQIGSRRDLAAAIDWYDQGLERGDAWGGANAAWVIANERVAGYSPGDAAVRAAKAATTNNAEAAREAVAVLESLSPRAIDAGAQTLMRDLGAEVTVDGAFGPASQQELKRIAARFDRTVPEDSQARLLALAKMYWETTAYRVDLY